MKERYARVLQFLLVGTLITGSLIFGMYASKMNIELKYEPFIALGIVAVNLTVIGLMIIGKCDCCIDDPSVAYYRGRLLT